jgi:hypothetical protein
MVFMPAKLKNTKKTHKSPQELLVDGVPHNTETNKTHFALFDIHNRAFGPYLTSQNRILISVMTVDYRGIMILPDAVATEGAAALLPA